MTFPDPFGGSMLWTLLPGGILNNYKVIRLARLQVRSVLVLGRGPGEQGCFHNPEDVDEDEARTGRVGV